MTLPDRHRDSAARPLADAWKEKSSEIRTGDLVEPLEGFQQSRAVIEDFSCRTLAAIPSDFGRLYYLSSLRDSASGRYVHDGLTSLYSDGAVQTGLAHCHEQLFSRILEMPLREQGRDLSACLDSAGKQGWDLVRKLKERENLQGMCPHGSPDYLHDLFRSNVSALLAVVAADRFN